MSKTHKTVAASDAQIDAALAQARAYDAIRPRAVAAEYDKASDRIFIALSSGVELVIPRRLLQGLETATPAQLSQVAVEDHGSALRWDALDVDHYIPGLVDGVFGTRKWMSEIGKKGGSARSEAKTQAVRENGLKGGRPRGSAALDARYRDSEGRVRVRDGKTAVWKMRQIYGDSFAPGARADMKLDTLLDRSGVTSLAEFQKRGR